MLLDGTPNIELALHASVVVKAEDGGAGGGKDRGGGGGVGSEGYASTRRGSFYRERPGGACETAGNEYGMPAPWMHGAGGAGPQAYPAMSFAVPKYYSS